jgi:hypothetical protein
MGIDTKYGWLIFFGVPLLLWLIGAGAAFKKAKNSPFFAYIAGSDHRLSLSRLQAFLWTLTIFGAFAAATAVHIFPSQADADKAKAAAQTAAQRADAAKKILDQTPAGAPERTERQNALDKAQADQQAAQKIVDESSWVNIPAALLALAGIAIGSGVFSSLIAASNSEDKTACVMSLQSDPIPDPAGGSPPLVINTLLINGQNLGDRGRVRFGRIMAAIRNWKSDGTQIQIDVPAQLLSVTDLKKWGPLVVDTPNGKLAYELAGSPTDLILGAATSYYEFVDLFRDDKSPDNLDLMKFQMFGWTVVAVVIYVYLFLNRLSTDLTALPTVPEGIVILTGLSQAGYLAGKGAANVK